MKKALAIIFSVLFIDQSIKVWVKTHMYLNQAHAVSGSWFYIHFVENPGMAFGLTIGDGAWGKLLLSIFRLLAVAGIGYYLWTLFKKNVRPLLIVCVALIFAGALGNIVDSVFYGKIFSASDPWDQNVAQFMPKDGGYDKVLHGQVVDMFYFPIYHGHYPSWLPSEDNTHWPDWFPRAGEDLQIFRPVFNIADAAISIGVFLLILFQRRLFGKQTQRLAKKKILVTNIFFGCIVFLISVFLLLTYFTLFSATHPLPSGKTGMVLALALALGYGMFDMLQRWPEFEPDAVDSDPSKIKIPLPENETAPNENSSTEEQKPL